MASTSSQLPVDSRFRPIEIAGTLLTVFTAVLGPFPRIPAALVTLGAIAFAVWRYRTTRQRSRLVRADAFVLRVENPAELQGREDDVASFLRRLSTCDQVVLIGLSGVGKSSFLEFGVLPSLKEKGGLAPILVSHWGRDPEAGPAQAVCDALRRLMETLPPNLAEDLPSPTPARLGQFLRKLQRATALTPVIIFDQIDEYVLTNRSALYDEFTHEWRDGESVADGNGFWLEIKALLKTRQIKIVTALRADQQDGARSVSFTSSIATFRLDPLRPGLARQILLDAAASHPEAVLNPQAGWEDLCEMIESDLAGASGVLPIRLKMVLAALPSLGSLTPEAYVRVGRLPGLESSFVERNVHAVAGHLRVDPATVAGLLEILTGEGAEDGPRAAICVADLRSLNLSPKDDPNKLEAILKELANRTIVKEVAEPDTGVVEYVLSHQYLQQAVRAYLLTAAPLSKLVAKRAAEFATVPWTHPARKWRLALPPATTLRHSLHLLRRKARLELSLDFVALCWARTLWLPMFAAALFVAGADAGWSLPFGNQVRASLDSVGLSVFRPIPTEEHLNERLGALRAGLTGELAERPIDEPQDPWAMAQIVAALASQSDLPPRHYERCVQLVQRLFSQGARLLGADGAELGWSRLFGGSYSVADPTLWVVRSVLAVESNPLAAANRDATRGMVEIGLRALNAFWEWKIGSVTPFPRQETASQASVYSTALALDFAIESVVQRRSWPGQDPSDAARACARWLVSTYVGPPKYGWPEDLNARNDIADGLTLQVYCALLHAQELGLVELTDEIREGMERHAGALGQRTISFKLDRGLFLGAADGQVSQNGEGPGCLIHFKPLGEFRGIAEHSVRYLWLPWGLEFLARWIGQVPRDFGSGARRALGLRSYERLLGICETFLARPAAEKYAFEMAELLLCSGRARIALAK